MKLSIQYPAPPSRRSVATSLVADGFGLCDAPQPRVIAENLEFPVEPGQRIAITGPSGSGKSSLLKALADQLAGDGGRLAWPDRLALADAPVIDAIHLPFIEAIHLLSVCGLSEPRLLIQSPQKLSEGERWRFRLALALSDGPDWLVIDEFAAAIDPTLARVLAFNLRRESLRRGCGIVAATCHAEPIDDFDPDIRLTCDHDGSITVFTRNSEDTTCSHYTTSSTSPPVPARTGRTSLGGIIAPKLSARCDS